MPLNFKIANLRKANKLSQECLADKMCVSRQAISRWEAGTSYPNIDNLVLLSDIFEISLDVLLREEVEDYDETKHQSMDHKTNDKVIFNYLKVIIILLIIILLHLNVLLLFYFKVI